MQQGSAFWANFAIDNFTNAIMTEVVSICPLFADDTSLPQFIQATDNLILGQMTCLRQKSKAKERPIVAASAANSRARGESCAIRCWMT